MHFAGVKERATRSRLIVLAAVISVHAAAFIFLVNLRSPSRSGKNEYVSLLWLPPHKRPDEPARPAPTVIKRVPLKVPPTSSFSVPSSAAAQYEPQPAIDWAEEAVREASAVASNAITPPKSAGEAPSKPAPSPFAPPPAHHAGESYRNGMGETVVWISDKCYQVSGTLLTVPDVMAHAMLPLTVCTGPSNKPRGDLFKDLPAYRKLHPDADQ